MSVRTLQPLSPVDHAMAAAELIQAIRANQSDDEIVALVDGHVRRMLGGQARPASATDFRVFRSSVTRFLINTAQVGALLTDQTDDSDHAALRFIAT